MERPKTRGDCLPMFKERFVDKVPCPWVSCKYNTFMTVKRNGEIQYNHGTDDVTEIKVANCALDYVDAGENRLSEIAKSVGMASLSHQAAQLMMTRAMAKVKSTEFDKDVETPADRAGHPLAEAQIYAL